MIRWPLWGCVVFLSLLWCADCAEKTFRPNEPLKRPDARRVNE